MHRPTLTLRRFGALSFGLGYFENGIWVDHSVQGAADGDASPSDGVALDAVHRWYGCCVDDSVAAHQPGSGALGLVDEHDRHAPAAARSGGSPTSVVALMPPPAARAVEK